MTKAFVLGGALAALACFILCAPLHAAEALPQDGAALFDELQDVLRRLRAERAEAYSRRRARAAEIENARTPLRRLETDIAELKAKEGETDKSLAEIRAELQQLQQAALLEAETAKVLVPEMDATSSFFRAFVEKGFPYRREDRLLRLGGPGPLPDRVGRAWSFAQEELRIARSGEAWSAEVQLPGNRAKPARLFRSGHLLCGYVTEDGLDSGLWTNGAWTPDESPAIRQAVEMLDRRRPPALLLLPLERRESK